MGKNILAIDIGGSKIVVGIVDKNGKVIASQKHLLPDNYDINFIIDCICTLAESFKAYTVVSAGVTIPGLADAEKGIWKYAPFSGISNIPITDILTEKLGVSVFAENDVNACAIAEKTYGVCKMEEDFLWLTVSNGIGGALYLNGEIYRGESDASGEIGHFIVEENTDATCGCGKKGCLEAMASGKGIETMYFKLTKNALDAKRIAQMARLGDETAIKTYEQAGYYIGKAIAYAVNLLNIKKIIIGGGVSQSFDLLENSIRETIERFVFVSANAGFEVKKTGLGYYAALIGAATVAQTKLK